jgi:hypothetical protein
MFYLERNFIATKTKVTRSIKICSQSQECSSKVKWRKLRMITQFFTHSCLSSQTRGEFIIWKPKKSGTSGSKESNKLLDIQIFTTSTTFTTRLGRENMVWSRKEYTRSP